jgi:hypothetical protein
MQQLLSGARRAEGGIVKAATVLPMYNPMSTTRGGPSTGAGARRALHPGGAAPRCPVTLALRLHRQEGGDDTEA